MLDEWSRKVVAWRVSRSLSGEKALALIDSAIITENLLDDIKNCEILSEIMGSDHCPVMLEL